MRSAVKQLKIFRKKMKSRKFASCVRYRALKIYLYMVIFVLLEFLVGITPVLENIILRNHGVSRSSNKSIIYGNYEKNTTNLRIAKQYRDARPKMISNASVLRRTINADDETSKLMLEMSGMEYLYQKCDLMRKHRISWANNKEYEKCSSLCPATPPCLGRVVTAINSPSFEVMETQYKNLRPGGRHSPSECLARHHVAVIIAYRNREDHLKTLLYNLHGHLLKQQLDYGIFVIEQAGLTRFNRAMLMNIGFKEAIAIYNFTCFIFHDVDHIPENDNNIYGCSRNPRHMAVAVEKNKYRRLYTTYFGGVSAMSRRTMEDVNGFSNMYFGWGGEDDDMWRRLHRKGYSVERLSDEVGRYRTLPHGRDRGNEANHINFRMINNATTRMELDGLSSLIYTRLSSVEKKLFTLISVNINETEVIDTNFS